MVAVSVDLDELVLIGIQHEVPIGAVVASMAGVAAPVGAVLAAAVDLMVAELEGLGRLCKFNLHKPAMDLFHICKV